MSIKRRKFPDGSVVCTSTKFAATETLPNTETAKSVVAALLECAKAPELPESNDPDLTGRYEGPHSTLCMNHAGWHIQLWWSAKLRGPEDRRSRSVRHLRADQVVETGRWEVFEIETRVLNIEDEERPPPLAVMEALGGDRVLLEWSDGSSEELMRYDERATRSQRALDALERVFKSGPNGKFVKDVDAFLRQEHRPLPRASMKGIVELFRSDDFRHRFEKLTQLEPVEGMHTPFSGQTHMTCHDLVLELEQSVANVTLAVLPPADRESTASFARTFLISEQETLVINMQGATKTLTWYEWLQRLRTLNESVGLGHVPTPAIIQWLGVEREQDIDYDVELDLIGGRAEAAVPIAKTIAAIVDRVFDGLPPGVRKKIADKLTDLLSVSAGGHVLVGEMTVRRRSGEETLFEQRYDVVFGAVSGGRGGGGADKVSFKAHGRCSTSVVYDPEDFAGQFNVFEGQAATWDGKREEGQHVWAIEGSRQDTGAYIIFDEVETDLSSHDLGMGWGMIALGDSAPLEYERPELKTIDHTATFGRTGDLHFLLGSATVRDEGRELLRMFAALELAAIQNENSRITIDGFADRLGLKWFNDQLSSSRANNTLQALRDCLGGKLMAESHVNGHGEHLLDLLGFPDRSASPEWRRVFVTLSGVVGVSLRVRDLKDVL